MESTSDDSMSPSSGFQEFEEEVPRVQNELVWSKAKRQASFQLSLFKHKHLKHAHLLRRTPVLAKDTDGGDFPDFSHDNAERLSRKNLASSRDFPFEVGCRVPDTDAPRANASFVMLARNSEVDDVVSSMKSMERHFNQWFNYPWVFLNDVEFDEHFKEEVRKHTKADVEFGLVQPEHWNFPADIDREELDEWIESQGDRTIMYGNMESYHKMCRFYSGHFYDHPLVRKREWYWRVEPDVKFFCDLTYDPFIEMEKNNKKYGFTVTIKELYYTAPSLFKATKAFIKENNIKVQSAWDIVAKKYPTLSGKNADQYESWEDRADLYKQVEDNVNLRRLLEKKNKTNKDLESIKEFQNVRNIFEKATQKPQLFEDRDYDEEYNLCHFWTNFEIAKTEVFLSQTYQDYFKYLEQSGGFYKERWGDAPVHSIAVAMMLPSEQLHYFRDIGYMHSTLGHCPGNAPGKQLPYQSNGYEEDALPWHKTFVGDGPDEPVRNGVGCRCECPLLTRELENRNSVCLKNFVKVLSDGYKPQEPIDVDKLERVAERKLTRQLQKGGRIGLDN
ncbi:glycosyl transferase [Metschnikowia bicuspidata var. bicuspidata NRRL YB-4993]|uniref:Glycosyl transferase n=1 Tax=Metschnikowia bicuspidata var. bicuspidata NRRL YB-4993 TaxID=869754 RepID=A0A1A0H288_9ASCO|nr:glycosyl transferase [Metschnikowia bicuspidata var. bicuspidata NRRL YB-4993]OBA18068.1 glycosyl transferase [Metschnikowia bicuspidata var. bicuspidata NRRL YB-4993]